MDRERACCTDAGGSTKRTLPIWRYPVIHLLTSSLTRGHLRPVVCRTQRRTSATHPSHIPIRVAISGISQSHPDLHRKLMAVRSDGDNYAAAEPPELPTDESDVQEDALPTEVEDEAQPFDDSDITTATVSSHILGTLTPMEGDISVVDGHLEGGEVALEPESECGVRRSDSSRGEGTELWAGALQ